MTNPEEEKPRSSSSDSKWIRAVTEASARRPETGSLTAAHTNTFKQIVVLFVSILTIPAGLIVALWLSLTSAHDDALEAAERHREEDRAIFSETIDKIQALSSQRVDDWRSWCSQDPE